MLPPFETLWSISLRMKRQYGLPYYCLVLFCLFHMCRCGCRLSDLCRSGICVIIATEASGALGVCSEFASRNRCAAARYDCLYARCFCMGEGGMIYKYPAHASLYYVRHFDALGLCMQRPSAAQYGVMCYRYLDGCVQYALDVLP